MSDINTESFSENKFWSNSIALTYRIMGLIIDCYESNINLSSSDKSEINRVAWTTRKENYDNNDSDSVFELVKSAIDQKLNELTK